MRLEQQIRATSADYLILILLCGLFLIGCKKEILQSGWPTEKMTTDGSAHDWSNLKSFKLFNEIGVVAGVSNDSTDLRILFRFKNSQWARAIVMNGLTIWIDPSDGKKKKFGMRYAGGPNLSELPNFGERMGRFGESMTDEQKDRFESRQKRRGDRIEIIDKNRDTVLFIPRDGSKGPAVAYASDKGIYTYEFSIPMGSPVGEYYAIETAPGRAISIGIEWGGMSKEDRKAMEEMRKERAGGGGGRRGGFGGGGRGGGGSRSGGMGRGGMEAQEYWLKVVLAKAPVRASN